MISWPVRDTICVECRTVLPAGTPCPAGPHRVEKLRETAGRDALLAEVWGPKSLRRRLKEAAQVGAAGGTGVSVLDGCSSCDLLDLGDVGSGHFWLVLGAAVIVIGIAWFAIKLVRDAVLRLRHRRRANGARRKGPQLGPSTGRIGTIISREVARPPIEERSCVAYSIVAHARGTVMLRDAVSLGFDVLLETGERVRVPAGACVLDMAGAARTELDRYLAELDPLRGSSDDLDPFPYDRACARVLVPGERVEVLGRLVPVADGGDGGSYREAARTLLVPESVPRLRLVT